MVRLNQVDQLTWGFGGGVSPPRWLVQVVHLVPGGTGGTGGTGGFRRGHFHRAPRPRSLMGASA